MASAVRRLAIVMFGAVIIVRTALSRPHPVSSSSSDAREFFIVEELPANSFVCNLISELGFDRRYDPPVVDRLRFSFLTTPAIFDRNYFAIDERSGVIHTTERIDREQLCPGGVVDCVVQYDVAVKPMEFFEIVKIKIEILDVNDHAPEFPQRRLRQRIAESADPQSSGIAVPPATDPDAGRNAIHKYEIYSTTDQFILDARHTADGGTDLRLLLRQPLDREHEDRYQVAVVALDGGNPPKSGSILVDISVVDVNDNAPVFDNDTYEVRVPEDVAPGTTVARVRARDHDLGLNGAVQYAFSPLTDAQHGAVFGIKPDSGKIFVMAVGLDHEQSPVHLLSVIAADGGPEPLTSHTTVVIRVDDVNDNSPLITVNTLTPLGVATVTENSEPGTFVAYVSVDDADSGDNGLFNCAVTTAGERFALRQTFPPGEFQLITAAAPLDRERRAGYDVTISCADAGGDRARTSQTVVHVNVADMNDNAPRFSRDVYEIEIVENCSPGTSVGRVEATDADDGPNGQFQYRLQGLPEIAGSPSLLHIDAVSGVISTRGEIDRESLPPPVRDGGPLELIVTAVDGGSENTSARMTATAAVRLVVLDVDDQVPVFDNDVYVFRVPENKPPGIVLGQVSALDADLPPHNVIRYHVARHGNVDVSSLFHVDSQSGTVSSRDTFDRERVALYHFDVVASGGGLSTLSARACVDVQVVDINDHRPLFTEPLWNNQTLLVSSQTPSGHVISWLRAVDLDDGRNARLTFKISAGNRLNTFALHPISGALTVAADISHVVLEEYALHVTVEDGGLPVALRDDTMLRVVVSRDVAYVPLPSETDPIGSALNSFGVLASETTAIVLSIALAVIITLIIVIAVSICVLRRRARSRRAQSSADDADDDKRRHPEVMKLDGGTAMRLCNRVELFHGAADGSTSGSHGNVVKCNGTARTMMANGGVSPYFAPAGYSGSITSSFTHATGSEMMNYYQVR